MKGRSMYKDLFGQAIEAVAAAVRGPGGVGDYEAAVLRCVSADVVKEFGAAASVGDVAFALKRIDDPRCKDLGIELTAYCGMTEAEHRLRVVERATAALGAQIKAA